VYLNKPGHGVESRVKSFLTLCAQKISLPIKADISYNNKEATLIINFSTTVKLTDGENESNDLIITEQKINLIAETDLGILTGSK